MNYRERQLLREAVGEVEPRLRIRTRARVDTGRWWGRTSVWLCLFDEELVLLSASRRRFLERVPLTECVGTRYSHATGELVLEPGEALPLNRVAISPRDALSVLDQLREGTRELISNH